MKGYVLSGAAQADIDEIWDYTATTWNVDQAERYVSDIREVLDQIVSGVKVGRYADGVKAQYLKIRVGSHFVFYRTDPTTVYIVRILHERMDVSSRLKG